MVVREEGESDKSNVNKKQIYHRFKISSLNSLNNTKCVTAGKKGAKCISLHWETLCYFNTRRSLYLKQEKKNGLVFFPQRHETE